MAKSRVQPAHPQHDPPFFAWTPRLAGCSAGDVVGIDPGIAGGAAVLRDFRDIVWAADWSPSRDDGLRVRVAEPMTGRVLDLRAPNLWGVLARLPTPEGARCTVERMFIGPSPKSDLDVLIEAAGVALGWAMSRALVITARPMASRWRADMLAMPARSDAKACDTALADVYAGRVPKHLDGRIDHGLRGDLSLLGPHSRDAVAVAAWGAGLRLTRAENRATGSVEAAT